MPRRLAAAIAVAAIAFGPLLVAAPASASPRLAPDMSCGGLDDGKGAPVPESPSKGIHNADRKSREQPPTGDPFTPGSGVTILDAYGYAGLTWQVYDVGCGGSAPNVLEAGPNSIQTAAANVMMTLPKLAVSFSDSVIHDAFNPQWLSAFDPFVERSTKDMQLAVYDYAAPVALVVVGILIVAKARKRALAGTAALIGWGLLVMFVATALVQYPLWAGHAVDNVLTTGTGAVATATASATGGGGDGKGTADRPVIGGVYDQVLYKTWLAGNFGDPDSPAAKRHGPALFDAGAMTWAEERTAQASPIDAKRILEAKQAKFKATADLIKAEDPAAYEYLRGAKGTERIARAWWATVVAALIIPLIVYASVTLVVAFLMIRFAVVVAPIIAPMAIVVRSVGMAALGRVTSTVWTALVFGCGMSVIMLMYGIALAADVNMFVRAIILLAIAFMGFAVLLSLASGLSGIFFKKKDGKLVMKALRTVGVYFGAKIGAQKGVEDAQDTRWWDDPSRQRAPFAGPEGGGPVGFPGRPSRVEANYRDYYDDRLPAPAPSFMPPPTPAAEPEVRITAEARDLPPRARVAEERVAVPARAGRAALPAAPESGTVTKSDEWGSRGLPSQPHTGTPPVAPGSTPREARVEDNDNDAGPVYRISDDTINPERSERTGARDDAGSGEE